MLLLLYHNELFQFLCLFHLCAFPPLPEIIYSSYSDNEADSDYVAYQVKQEYANIYMLQEGHSEL